MNDTFLALAVVFCSLFVGFSFGRFFGHAEGHICEKFGEEHDHE